MSKNHKKYIPFTPQPMTERRWPGNVLTKAPIWCSVDLRDGNQSLIDPMNLDEKLEFFKLLVDIGFKEIEVGFPSASETEYTILRTLIDGGHIPDDVTIQVLVQARPHLIEKTFDAIRGAKNVILHFYNSTSALQRKVVFRTDMAGIIDIAVQASALIREMGDRMVAETGMNLRYEYSPESFSGTETDNAVSICQRVMEAIGATAERPIILNLPSTVEGCMPNQHADQIEHFIQNLPNRNAAIISLHPHNDRGTGVAAAELALLAGAQRVEGTLFGNGERTGNVDLITLALNLHTQGIDPKLDFSNLPKIRELYQRTTKLPVHPRHPYAGDLVFTAFSGSHQDAVNKGVQYMKSSGSPHWEIPYLPIDPADVGRHYEPIIRINSQSGKGGTAFIMETVHGYQMPRAMHPEFGTIVQAETDRRGTELLAADILEIFQRTYLEINGPYRLLDQRFSECQDNGDGSRVEFHGTLRFGETDTPISGTGNGPIDAFFNAVQELSIAGYSFESYHQHAISAGSDSKAVTYIQLKCPQGFNIFGVGVSSNISRASIYGVLCAINRAILTAGE